MTRLLKLILSALFALALLLAGAAGILTWLLSGDGLRTQVQALASERLGVPVTLGALSFSVLPSPALAASDVRIATQMPLTAQRIELRPAWRKLLSLGEGSRELEVESLTLRGLKLPQRGMDQLSQSMAKKTPNSLSKTERSTQQTRRLEAQNAYKNFTPGRASEPASQGGSDGTAHARGNADALADKSAQHAGAKPVVTIGLLAIPAQTRLEGVVWQSAAGESLSVSGDLLMSPLRDQMQVNLQLAGGSVRGPVRLASKDGKKDWQLRGTLSTSGVDLAQLPGARQRMSGRLQGTTTLDAAASQLAGIGAALQTRTAFQVSAAVIKGVDLAKAVRTLGLSRDGETALQQLSGNLATRGSGAAMLISLTDLQAASSILQASGQVNIGAAASAGAPRALSGKLNVDLSAGDSKIGQAVQQTVGQLVGIPLEISGTTAAPQVQPTRGAMIGGVIGSVIAPVIGTGAGAKMGDKAAQKLESWRDMLFGK